MPLGGAASMKMVAAAPACGLAPGLVLCRCAEGAGVTGPAGVACRDEGERFAQRPRQPQQNQPHSPRKMATSQSRVADTVHIQAASKTATSEQLVRFGVQINTWTILLALCYPIISCQMDPSGCSPALIEV